MSPTATSRPQVQRHTFYLLGCEGCGRFTEPPKRLDLPDFARPTTEPMRCNDCGELLLLAECAPWRHVVYAESLPERAGRQVWTDA